MYTISRKQEVPFHCFWYMPNLVFVRVYNFYSIKRINCSKHFLDLVSVAAEEQGHHPAMTISYNKLKITLTTHAAGGLTENDFIMAGLIDKLGS